MADKLERPAMQGAAIIAFVAMQRKPNAEGGCGMSTREENSSFDRHLQR